MLIYSTLFQILALTAEGAGQPVLRAVAGLDVNPALPGAVRRPDAKGRAVRPALVQRRANEMLIIRQAYP